MVLECVTRLLVAFWKSAVVSLYTCIMFANLAIGGSSSHTAGLGVVAVLDAASAAGGRR